MKTIRYILLTGIITLLPACGKEEDRYALPGYVNFEVNVNIQDGELKTPTNYKQFTQPRLSGESVGYSGLLVVCSAVPVTSGIFQLYAYDLCCRHENRREIKIVPQPDGVTAKCPVCGSVYNIFNGLGNVVSGPSENNLQRYYAIYSGTRPGVFRITRTN
ncbi:MAG: hypothetical protein LBL79_13585 [Prevotella sp.]|jgi:hypothetical protein|nr:hypothetical protein [Prevotella sp.]